MWEYLNFESKIYLCLYKIKILRYRVKIVFPEIWKNENHDKHALVLSVEIEIQMSLLLVGFMRHQG